MFLFLGLGNPGPKYLFTRHNVGFRFIDRLSRDLKIPLYKAGYHSFWGSGSINGVDIILAKPMTYMNNSGLAAAALVRKFGVDLSSMLVVYDDLDLPLGSLRLRPQGGSGGHNGMKSIIFHLQTESFPRMRIGIGRPQGEVRDVIDYVLEEFTPAEEEVVESVLTHSTEAAKIFLTDGIQAAMNRFNHLQQK